ncbi:GGDEF domain-containing protein [Christensenella intestinihominis]|uniref:GGDEF domain-containing protein n=1 Tax=Christensenella intestinihominis TaxID=1851429 RepID=UPI0008303F54|nr:GGDEF domain-containing protein [Christensenella intestinihominis]
MKHKNTEAVVPQVNDEELYLKKVYRNIILLALFAHGSYILIFASLNFLIPSVYNVGSVIFYFFMLYTTRRGLYRLSVTLIHVEVCLFVTACTLTGGWALGVEMYLVAMSSLVYFCPFHRKYIPYLFALAEAVVFFLLFFYLSGHGSYYEVPPKQTTEIIFLYNAATCFIIIIYSAFLSRVSATVNQQQLEKENDGLTILANYDQLTGLLTRRAFLDGVEEPGDNRKPGALVMADIDNFKRINDTYGHQGGDYVLRTVAELIRAGCRQADVCRYGGEEFLLMIYGTGWEESTELVQRMCDDIAAHSFLFQKNVFHVTVTFGMCKTDKYGNLNEWISCADKRLYIGKARGKNQVVAH